MTRSNFDSHLPGYVYAALGSVARDALPGPALFSPHGDITAVLMAMVEQGALTESAAWLVAWARGERPYENGAYFNAQCRPRIVWRGADWDAVAFADSHARTSDVLLASDFAQSRQKLATWHFDDEDAEIAPTRFSPLWRACGAALAMILALALIVGAIWALVMIFDGLWLMVTGGLL